MQIHLAFTHRAGPSPVAGHATDRLLVTLATRMCAFLAERRLLAVGYRERDVRVVEGAQVLADIEACRMDADGRATLACLDSLAQHARFWAADARHARAGAASCTDDAMARDVCALVRPLQPRSIRRYRSASMH